MEERKKRELTTPTKPASKKKAQFETLKKIRQKFKELQIIDDLNYDLPDQVIQNGTCGEASFSVLDTNSEDRVQEQATCISNFSTKTTATALNSSISLLMLRTGCPLLQEELLLYALVSISFPENQFNFKAKSKEKYDPIIGVIHNVYHTRFNNHDLKNYFQRASHNLVKDLGKVKGVLRWVYYKNRLIEVLEKFKVLLTELLLGNVVPCDQIEELRHFISEQCEQIDSGEPNQEKPEVKLVSDDFNEQIQTEDVSELHILKEFPKWKANYCEDKNSVHFFYFSGNVGYAEIEVIINSDKSWTVVLDGIVRSTASLNWADIPSHLSNLSELQELLTIIQNSRICKGCPLEPFIDIVSNDTSKPVFYTKDREPAAYVDIKLSHFHEKVIRSTSCSVFLPGMDDLVCSKSMCDLCSKTQHYLRTKKSRVKNKNVLEEARAAQHNFVVMSKEELLTVARKQSNELRNLHKQIQRLEKHREKMNEVGEKTNSDLKFMFDKLTKGIGARNERLQNPIFMWKGCSEKFSNVDMLYSHVKDHIPDFDSSVAPINRSYSCLWEKCEKKFTKKKLLQNHIIDHTGSTSDQFFEILLNDQAKALTVPSRQMRWHPLVIKWCLRIYSKSHSVYEDMKESGFIKLPSGRTLSDYKNFCSPKSGWNTASIIAMKDKFEKMKLKKYAKIGALIFDEIKIKEGLVFDPSTWELIGFTDLDDNCDNSKHTPVKEQPEEKLATHILQFFFKNLSFQ